MHVINDLLLIEQEITIYSGFGFESRFPLHTWSFGLIMFNRLFYFLFLTPNLSIMFFTSSVCSLFRRGVLAPCKSIATCFKFVLIDNGRSIGLRHSSGVVWQYEKIRVVE